MTIHPFHVTDTAVLARLHTQLFPDRPQTAVSAARLVADVREAGGYAWIASDAERVPVGYAIATPLPGLPGLLELDGGILPAHRRQGHGTRLLQRLLADLAAAGARQLSASVPAMDAPAARFLLARGFHVEHVEWTLQRPTLAALPPLALPRALRQRPFSTPRRAIPLFLDLYDRSFGGHPWHQPYSPGEVAGTLADPADLLFLWHLQTPIGFAWLHLSAGTGEIEPFGILPAWQGQGNGRILLTAALHALARRGAASAQIGAWRQNAAAIHLYQQLGFRHAHTLTYLAQRIGNE